MDLEYDVAISFLWPHDYVAYKVKSKMKIAWIHTDYTTNDIDVRTELEMLAKFDYLVSISDECTHAFLSKFPALKNQAFCCVGKEVH